MPVLPSCLAGARRAAPPSLLPSSALHALRPVAAALAPLALCLAHSAQAQTTPIADAATPQLQEVRIDASADGDAGLGFAPAQAQTAGKAPMRRLETPQSISVVTREQMESRQIVNVQQALQTVAGVSPVNYGRRGFDDLNIRGFRATESVLVDGLLRNPSMWAKLHPYGYERIEVLKGSASVLYGQVQPGGVVHAISKRPRPEPMGEVGVELGSFGLRTLQADINRPLSASGKTALRINALASDSDDPTQFVYRKDRWLGAALSLDLGPDTDLVLQATYSSGAWLRQQGITPHGTLLPNPNGRLPLTRYAGEPRFGIYDMENTTAGYTLQHRLGPSATLRQNLRYERTQGTGNFVGNELLQADGRTQNRSAMRQAMDYDQLAIDTSLLQRFQALGLRHQLVTGLDARTGHSLLRGHRCQLGPLDLFAPRYGMAATCPAAPTSDAPAKLTVAGLYAQDQIQFGNGWTALVGLRHDWSSTDTNDRVAARRTRQRDSATTLSAGLVYEFRPGWSSYLSYGQSFLPVTGQTFGGQLFEPETGKQWEAGLKYEAPGGRWNGALAVFELVRRNVATADPAHTGFSVQTGEQRARGLELELGADLANGWKLTSAYTYTQTEVTRDNNPALVGRALLLTPRHVLTAWATYRLPQWPGLTLGLGGRHVSEQTGSLPFTLPAYTVADASLTYTSGSYRITAGVKNLFDKAYYDGAINASVISPAAPRSFSVGLTHFF